MKNRSSVGIGISTEGKSREEREAAFYKGLVLKYEHDLGVRLVRPFPTSLDDLQIKLPKDGSLLLKLLEGFVTFEDAYSEARFIRPALLWAEQSGYSPSSIAAILQLTEIYKKVDEVCASTFVDQAVELYHQDEKSLAAEPWFESAEAMELLPLVQDNILRWIGEAPESLSFLSLVSGPGAVASQQNHVLRWTDPIPFGVWDVFGDLEEFFFKGEVPQLGDDESCRMIAVPKTSTKPRLISAEPSWLSFGQQAVRAELEERVNRHAFMSVKTQDRNAALTFRPDIATIDQSRASDRIPASLVAEVFPLSWGYLMSNVRSKSVDCLCGETHPLSKYAGMGSAVTFPMETLVFASVVVAALRRELQVERLSEDIMSKLGIFGDDVIIPREYTKPVELALTSFGFIVNREKSFSSGGFRESCGVYSFRGVDVTPLRRSQWLPDSGSDVDKIEAVVSFLNRMELRFDNTGDLRPLTGIVNMPAVSYDIDTTSVKIGLIRNKPGFGWWNVRGFTTFSEVDTCMGGFSWDSFHENAVRRSNTFKPVSDRDESARMKLSIFKLEQESLVNSKAPPAHVSPPLLRDLPVAVQPDRQYEPRPAGARMKVR